MRKVRELREDKQEIERELVLKKEKTYMPKYKKLRLEVIQLHYNVLVDGYKSRWKIIKLVTRNYWWPGVTKNIGKYVKECDLYEEQNRGFSRKVDSK